MNKLMTPEEVAELLGVPRRTLTVWRYEGIGPKGFKVGRHVRYRLVDVESWIEEQLAAESIA